MNAEVAQAWVEKNAPAEVPRPLPRNQHHTRESALLYGTNWTPIVFLDLDLAAYEFALGWLGCVDVRHAARLFVLRVVLCVCCEYVCVLTVVWCCAISSTDTGFATYQAVAAAVSGTPGQVEVTWPPQAVPRRGSKLVTYKTIAEIPLPGYVPPPSESESDLDFDDSEESDDDFVRLSGVGAPSPKPGSGSESGVSVTRSLGLRVSGAGASFTQYGPPPLTS
eukprot:3108797-Rhodomonas_salina.1